MGPTPQLYYSVFAKNTDGGVQVTASHNPGDQNGFKMMVGKKTLSGAAIQELRQGVEQLLGEGFSATSKRGVVQSWNAEAASVPGN